MVQFEVDGHVTRVGINDELEVYSKEDFADEETGQTKTETPQGLYLRNQWKGMYFLVSLEPTVQLPEAQFHKLENYNICDAPPRPKAYIRFIEKSAEELDGEVIY